MAMSNPILPFLRPLALPKPSTVRTALRNSPSYRSRIEAIPALAYASSNFQCRANSTSAIDQSQITTEPLPSQTTNQSSTPASDLKYYLARTRSLKHRVYHMQRNGTRRETHVKKIEGDIFAFEQDLKSFLEQRVIEAAEESAASSGKAIKIPAIQTQIKPILKQVRVKGFHREGVVAFLEKKGF